MLTLFEYEQSNELMIAAHRGASATAPENTLAAFEDAINSGVKIIELDIQITADNRIVVFHDFIPKGCSKRISEMNYSQIKNLKIDKKFQKNFDSVHIPLLQEVIDLVKGKCYLMIEIKIKYGDNINENVKKIIEQVIDNNYEMNTIFGSFNYSALKSIKELSPSIYTAAIKIPLSAELPSKIREEICCDAFICSIHEMNMEINEDVTKNKIFSGVYSIESETELNKALGFNVRAIATNHPGKIINLLNKHKITDLKPTG